MSLPPKLILTCEHGGNDVPPEYLSLLDTPLARQYRRSHRGWDPGALDAANFFAEQSSAILFHSTTTRLLVDLNRSVGHPQLFSRFTSPLPETERNQLLHEHYYPYRQRVHRTLREAVDGLHCAVHVSVHSFTPKFRGVRRNLDVGLLFDPDRPAEQSICQAWRQCLLDAMPGLRVELNQPYLGIDDGLTTAMRGQFSDSQYAGIELEINSQMQRRAESGRRRLWKALVDSLMHVVEQTPLTIPSNPDTNSEDTRSTLS